jgi:hypothetical protein
VGAHRAVRFPKVVKYVTTLIVIGGIVLFVAALLAFDWFMAGRIAHRRLRFARDGEVGNPNIDYAEITQVGTHINRATEPFGG